MRGELPWRGSQRSNSKRRALTNLLTQTNEAAETKKAGKARFSASGLAGHPVCDAASSSVVSAAPEQSKGIIPSHPATSLDAHAGLLESFSRSSQ
jgi:hypothetical protein